MESPSNGRRQALLDDIELVESYVRNNSQERIIWTSVKPAPVTRAEALRALARLRAE